MKIPHPDYAELRRKAYDREMPIRDQLDAIMKGGDALDEMRRRALAIKARIPKPEPGSGA